jgi:hypothetical protein
MDTAAGAIARAIESGMDLRLKGEADAAAITSSLGERLAGMELLRSELVQIREELKNQC